MGHMEALTQEAAEGDGGGQGGEVDEDDGRQDLGAQGICDVTQVVGVAAPDVTHQSPEELACPLQRVFWGVPWTFPHICSGGQDHGHRVLKGEVRGEGNRGGHA